MKTDPIEKLYAIAELILKQRERPFSISSAAEYIGISKSCLYKLTNKNQITHYKPNGKMIFFKQEDLDKYVYRNKKVDKEKKITSNYKN